MQPIRFIAMTFMGWCLLLGACSAQPAGSPAKEVSIHVIMDASDRSDHGKRVADELAAAGMNIAAAGETVDNTYMPFISQVRFYQPSDQALAERALQTVKRYRSHPILVPMPDADKRGRVDIFLSTHDQGGVALQPVPSEPLPEPPVITDEAFRVVFNPDDHSHDPLKSAPPTARAFLAAARQADAIDDPLARCLAYPDLPGDQWPPQLVRALCDAGNAHALTMAEAKAYVAQGQIDALEARMAKDLARHFETGKDRSEVIHRDLKIFSNVDDAGETIRAWRQAAPNSAFAYAAEASFLEGQAWRVRGADTSDKVSSGQFGEMHRLAARATEAAQAAVRIEPKMLPAWHTLIELGQLESQADLRQQAYQAAIAVDPGCYRVNQAWMLSLRPRWGGSYEAMDAFAATLATAAKKRPLLALVAVMPDWDRALDAKDNNDLAQVAHLLKPHLLQVPSPDALQLLGSVYPDFVIDGRWEGIAYLLEAVRFGDCGTCTKVPLAYDLMGIAGDRDWAVIQLQRQVRDDPDDLSARFTLGMARYQQARYPEATAELLWVLARAKSERMRHDTLSLLVSTYQGAGDIANAQRYAAQLAQEAPDAKP